MEVILVLIVTMSQIEGNPQSNIERQEDTCLVP